MYLKEKIISFGVAKESDIMGLSVTEITDIEQAEDVVLPRVYKDFMLVCGRKIGDLFSDVDFFYPDVKILNSNMRERIKEREEEEAIAIYLPKNHFVFSGYGNEYRYFLCNSDDVY